MIKMPVIGAAALILGVGYAWAIDETQGTPPTADPSSSGRPSAILSQSACQDLWSEAQSSSGISESASPQSSSDMSSSGANTGSTSPLTKAPSVAGSDDTGNAPNAMGQSDQPSSSNLSSSSSSQDELSKEQASRYIANFAMVDKNADGQISQAEFQDGCQKGSVQAASSSGSGQSDSSSSSSKSGG